MTMASTIILDTSFLVACAERKADWQDGLRELTPATPAILDKTLQELGHIKQRGGKKAAAAQLVRALLTRLKTRVIRTPQGKGADDLLVEKASPLTLVATMDAELKRRIKRKGCKVVILRQGRRFSFG